MGRDAEGAIHNASVLSVQHQSLHQTRLTRPHVIARNDDAEREERPLQSADDWRTSRPTYFYRSELGAGLLEANLGARAQGVALHEHRGVQCQLDQSVIGALERSRSPVTSRLRSADECPVRTRESHSRITPG